jgi:streptogramin lyase
MRIRRRDFFGTAIAAGVGVVAVNKLAAQEPEAPARGGGRGNAGPPTRPIKTELLYKSPDRYPNALEAAPDGLWVGDQVSERINKLDWTTGKVLEDFIGEAHNTSGIAVGDGHIWVGCNGSGTAASLREFKRPFDKNYGEIVQLDMKGKQVKGYRNPWGGVHGTAWDHSTNHLWAVAPGMQLAIELDPKDDLRILRMVSIGGGTAHGIEIHDGALWILAAADRLVRKHDLASGRVLEVWTFGPDDPDPHGMCIHNGYVYFCDAGLGGGRKPSAGTKPSYIARFSLKG